MNHEEFSNKTGHTIRAPKGIYHTFQPNHLPLPIIYDDELVNLLSEAVNSIGNLSGISRIIKNPNLMIRPYMDKEAVLSSKIEGTRTTLSEVFLHHKESDKKKKETENNNPDLQEVINYIKALKKALERIRSEAISEQLLLDTHKLLMTGVRGHDKDPGMYKLVQNWIGTTDDVMDAKFVPASPESTEKLMKNLITFINEEGTLSPLIKVAMIHYQIETIHPFRDGNGRIGRLLIILYLMKKKLLSIPTLYLSAYFESHKSEYTNRLFEVSSKGKIEDWIKFFLRAVKEQADDAFNRALKLENYRQDCIVKLDNISRGNQNIKTVLDMLFSNPFITIKEVMDTLEVKYPSAKYNINILLKAKIIEEFTGRKRGKMYECKKIHQILEPDREKNAITT